MACLITDVESLCSEEIAGGLIQTVVGEIDDVNAWTEDVSGNVATLTMKTGKKMYVINWEEETADYNLNPIEAPVGARNYQVGYTHAIDGVILGQDGTLAAKLDNYVKCRCGLFIINIYSSGAKVISGLRYNKADVVGTPNKKAKFIAKAKSASGKQLTNTKTSTLMLEARTVVPFQNFLGVIPLVAAS
jgi:hypothetical protein